MDDTTDPKSNREFLEDAYLDKIEEGLEKGTITKERAQELAGLVLDNIRDEMSTEDLEIATEVIRKQAPEFNS